VNSRKEIKSPRSRYKVQGWIKLFISVFIVAIGIVNFGCKCDCEEAADEYYVKYEVISTTANNAYMLHATVNNEKNNDVSFNFAAGSQWETIIGPVQKGFNASLDVSAPTTIIFHLKIYVSKYDSPFAIKANDSSETFRTSGQLSYTIDY
jgi:hypothetical protein